MKIETPILKRLGPIPFWRGEKKCLDALEAIYRRAREAADAKARTVRGLLTAVSLGVAGAAQAYGPWLEKTPLWTAWV